MRAIQAGSRAHRVVHILLLSLALVGAPASAGTSTILYFEPVVPLEQLEAGAPGQPAADQLSFDAFGRRFTLQLAGNDQLNRKRRSTAYTLLTGELQGLPGSWARLMRQGQKLSGLISDGTDIYALEPWHRARNRVLESGNMRGSVNIIYRLDDLLMPPQALTCELAKPEQPVRTAAQAYAELATEMGVPPTAEAQGATRRITLAAVADYEFVELFQRLGEDPEAEILARVNMVDGLYSEQFALQVELAETTAFPTANDPFTENVATDLLNEVSDYRLDNHAVNGNAVYGLTHLLTGRRLEGTTRGIAWLGGACRTLFGAALSAHDADAVTGALIMAHEIGHNLNARHDGEISDNPADPNPCESVPRGYLMWPVVDGSDQFSQCSLDTMTSFIAGAGASCVSALGSAAPPPAASVPGDSGGGGGGGGALGLPALGALLALLRRRRSEPRSGGRPRNI